MGQKVQICFMNKDVEITSFNDELYAKYSKMKVISSYQLGTIFNCETECGNYLWVEARSGKIYLCLAETSNEIGDHVEIVSKYQGGKPSFQQIATHMKWSINEEDVWTD